MERATDAELVDASRRGERAAFGELVERCARMVEAVSYAATRDRVLSEDITQDTFVAAWRDLGRLRDASAVRPWLCRIARNLAHKARRRRRPEVATNGLVTDRTPFDAVSDSQAEQVVRAALAYVPDVYREALVLFYYEQQSARDVALALGVTEGIVHKRLSRGRRYLAESIEKLLENALERPRKRRELVALVLAALPAVAASSRANAAPKGPSMWKTGIAAIGTLAIGTVAAWSHPPAPQARAHAAVVTPGRDVSPSSSPSSAAPRRSVPRPPSLPPQPAVTCAQAARHVIDLLDGSPDLVTHLEDQCRDESWSQRELACMLAADSALAADACKAPRPLAEPVLAPPGTDVRCAAVADHMLAISPPVAHDERPEAQYATLHAQIEDLCASEAWSELRRRCMIVAPTGRALVPCLGLDATSPAPVAVDVSCATVGAHVADVVTGDLADLAGLLDPQELADHLTSVCTEERWPASHRSCLAAAKNPVEITMCRARPTAAGPA